MDYVSLEVPRYFLVESNDYHEFSAIRSHIQKVFFLEYQFEEVAFNGKHRAVFWLGDRPSEFIGSLG